MGLAVAVPFLDRIPLPVLVFLAELCVVTLATLRIIFLSRGRKLPAAVLGFFEITLWLFAIGQIMQNLSDLGCFFGFAAGFTCGNYLGVLIEQRLAIGTLVVRTITHKDAGDLTRARLPLTVPATSGWRNTRVHMSTVTLSWTRVACVSTCS